jgi:ribonuclease HI
MTACRRIAATPSRPASTPCLSAIQTAYHMKFYAVAHGLTPGIYTSWPDASKNVTGFSKAVYRSFTTRTQAEEFMSQHGAGSTRAAPVSASTPSVSAQFPRSSATTSATSSGAAPAHEARGGGAGKPERTFVLRFDGASKGNPGPAGSGSVLFAPNGTTVIAEKCTSLGSSTNNRAEITGLLEGLRLAASMGVRRLRVEGDSELVVKQFNGIYQVHDEVLRGLHADIKKEVVRFESVTVHHIYREGNADADRVANSGVVGRTATSVNAMWAMELGLVLPSGSDDKGKPTGIAPAAGVKRDAHATSAPAPEAKKPRKYSLDLCG